MRILYTGGPVDEEIINMPPCWREASGLLLSIHIGVGEFNAIFQMMYRIRIGPFVYERGSIPLPICEGPIESIEEIWGDHNIVEGIATYEGAYPAILDPSKPVRLYDEHYTGDLNPGGFSETFLKKH